MEGRDEGGTGRIESVHRFKTTIIFVSRSADPLCRGVRLHSEHLPMMTRNGRVFLSLKFLLLRAATPSFASFHRVNRVNRKNGVGGVWFRRVDDPIDPRPPVAISSHENPRHLLVRELIWGREGGRVRWMLTRGKYLS